MTLKVLQDFCRRKRGASAEEKTGRFKSLVKSPVSQVLVHTNVQLSS